MLNIFAANVPVQLQGGDKTLRKFKDSKIDSVPKRRLIFTAR